MAEKRVECDVLVVGSGCAGMAAATTATARGLKVIVVEKAPHHGGTTSRSGGWLIDATGAPIAGLYAAGNDAASVMGGEYTGAGITLGPALTFGFIAAQHMAEQSRI